MTELEQLRKRVAYLERVRETAWRQLGEKDTEITRLHKFIKDQRRELAALAAQGVELAQLGVLLKTMVERI